MTFANRLQKILSLSTFQAIPAYYLQKADDIGNHKIMYQVCNPSQIRLQFQMLGLVTALFCKIQGYPCWPCLNCQEPPDQNPFTQSSQKNQRHQEAVLFNAFRRAL